jgi:hypothetical protein
MRASHDADDVVHGRASYGTGGSDYSPVFRRKA